MAKYKKRIKAQELREKGQSIKEIAKRIGVAKSSVSLWCRDIKLTQEQLERLQKKMLDGSYEGRLKGAKIQMERRLERTLRLNKEGMDLVGRLSKREIMLIGAGLYWGEGMKSGKTRIANSDPDLIKFIINWFKIVWGIPKEQFSAQVLINRIHKGRVSEVERYWSRITGIPLSQFTKTTLIKSKNKKIYRNSDKYFGTLIIAVRKGTNLHHKILGMIGGIKMKDLNSPA